MGRDMSGVHTPSGTVISPTLISPERYKWLHRAHSQRARPEAFAQDLLKLLARYHPTARSMNPQGRKLKLANHWATMPTLQQALERTFLFNKELFGSPLNCSVSGDISYCSTFPEDEILCATTDSFLYRWTGSCIANPEYEPGDMLKASLHALSYLETQNTPFLDVLILPFWDDTPWNFAAIRGHHSMLTLIRISEGHMRFVPTHKHSDETTPVLSPAKWPVEFVLIANDKGWEKFVCQDRIHQIRSPAIQATCLLTSAQTRFFPTPPYGGRFGGRLTPISRRSLPTMPATPAHPSLRCPAIHPNRIPLGNHNVNIPTPRLDTP